MKKYLFLLFNLFWIIGFQNCIAQAKKPKIALVLSGGGAKGIAHVPTLQVLDSLGIVPDLIVGNSMGSIVGGLYAMGYSGDSIASIAKNANWDKLMGGGVSLRDVSVEEKSEYDRYLINLDWTKGKIDAGTYLLNDQNIREFISSLTYPTYNITDFDSLAIPFRAIATDIVNGKEIIFDKGSLSFAMRASMSIPGAFNPVPYKNTLLVDGGILNNFPVDIAKKMGADIIIGSDVGGGMLPKEKLNNISDLLFQAGMLVSNIKIPENRKLCDILIDHTNNLTYSTSDFGKVNVIYNEGKIATQQNIAAFVDLAEKLKGFEQRKVALPNTPNEFILDTIIYKGISKENMAMVKARTNINPHEKYTFEDITEGINRAMGTTIFNQITFNPILKNKKVGLELNGHEKSKHQLKGSLHYNRKKGVGLVVNYTGRNILVSASRAIITIDIAEQPKFRLQHQKNFSIDRNWWWQSEIFGQQLEHEVFIEGEKADNIRHRYFEFNNQVNRNISFSKSYVGAGLKYENINLKPTAIPKVSDNFFSLDNYNFNTYEFYLQYSYNSLNDVFYATRGALFHTNISQSFYNKINMKIINSKKGSIEGSTNDYTKLGITYIKRVPISKTITGIIDLNTAFIFDSPVRGDKVERSRYGIGSNYFLGGIVETPRKNSFTFPGLYESELTVTQFMHLNLGLLLNPMNKLYIKPHVDIASVGFGKFKDYIKASFSASGNWTEAQKPSLLMSAGAIFSYDSVLGPVSIDFSWVNNTNRVRFLLGVGLPLNRSN